MKILQISNYYYPHKGGIEQTAHDIAKALCAEESVEQRVFCFNCKNKNEEESVDGVTVNRCGSLIKISSQSISIGYKKRLKKTFKDFVPDTVIFHFPNPFGAHYLLKLLKKRPECKLVLYYHLDITKQKVLGKFFKGQTGRLLNRAVKIIATSPDYIEGSPFLKRYKEKCAVVPSCINGELLKDTAESRKKCGEIKKDAADRTIVFAVGRHVEYKGLEYLIRASKMLDDSYRIYIGGEGPLTESLKKLASGDKKIFFVGAIDDAELKSYYSACDIFCFPSITKNEAFGLALAEALYFGKPAVTFKIEGSGVNYVNLNGVTGLEVENKNVEDYAKAIKTIAENSDLRIKMGAAAAERAKNLFTPERFSENIRREIFSI